MSSASENVTDDEIKEIHRIVTSIKDNAERRHRYMTLQDMIQYEKEESYDEGVEQGIKMVIKIYINTLREYNITEDKIQDSVIQNFGIPKDKAMELMA